VKSGLLHVSSSSSTKRSTPGSATSSHSSDATCHGCQWRRSISSTRTTARRALPELFDGRSQLLVYHFMFGPSYQAGCPVNSSIADTVDGVLPHLHSRDVTFLLVSQARLEKLQAYKRRMGSALPWVLDCTHRLQLRPRLLAHGGTRSPGCGADDGGKRASADRRAERPRVRHLCRRLHDGEPRLQRLLAKRRAVYHAYSTTWRGLEFLMGYYPILDRAPRPATRARRGSSGSADTTSTTTRDGAGESPPTHHVAPPHPGETCHPLIRLTNSSSAA
jgi:hypothetical protein